MQDKPVNHVFLSYHAHDLPFVSDLALRLRGDARLAFWFEPWHAIPGRPLQEQMEDALARATSCAVFIGPSGVVGWQNEQMRAAIQAHVEDDPLYRVIPVLLPGVATPRLRDLPRFLRLYHPVHFTGPDDDQAFRSLLAGILGIAPIEVEGFLDSQVHHIRQELQSPTDGFAHGHALLIGVAHYRHIAPHLPVVADDIAALAAVLTDPARCGYRINRVARLLDQDATRDGIAAVVSTLAARTGPDAADHHPYAIAKPSRCARDQWPRQE